MIKINIIFFVILFSATSFTQVLNVPQVIQEQDQWCWAAVSKCVLNYYGVNITQCQVAEYTRQSSTWHNFGSFNCCSNPNMGCNYWNYNYGCIGSIQDILQHWNVQNDGVAYELSTVGVTQQIAANRPFIIRWAWTSGGGHFIVGHGLVGNTLYYMNPWVGEGLKFANYSWVVSNSDHLWTHTNIMNSSPSAIPAYSKNDNIFNTYPNPVNNELVIENISNISTDITCEMKNTAGQTIRKIKLNSGQNIITINDLESGVYFMKITSEKDTYIKKIIKL